MKRPAETASGACGVALLLGLVLGLDPDVAAAVGVVLGFVPAAVTVVVNAGGVRGVVRRVWSGR